jgi:hypothetical protein
MRKKKKLVMKKTRFENLFPGSYHLPRKKKGAGATCTVATGQHSRSSGRYGFYDSDRKLKELQRTKKESPY